MAAALVGAGPFAACDADAPPTRLHVTDVVLSSAIERERYRDAAEIVVLDRPETFEDVVGSGAIREVACRCLEKSGRAPADERRSDDGNAGSVLGHDGLHLADRRNAVGEPRRL